MTAVSFRPECLCQISAWFKIIQVSLYVTPSTLQLVSVIHFPQSYLTLLIRLCLQWWILVCSSQFIMYCRLDVSLYSYHLTAGYCVHLLHMICVLFADAKFYILFFFRDVRRDRECVMCMYEEVSVVFLPCAHQVVCAGCDEVHKNHGISNCPSCRTPIQQRIRVYGPS